MKTQMKTLFVFLMAAVVAVSCGKNESGGGSNHNYGVGGDYSIIGGSNNQASQQYQQAFNAARNWFNQEATNINVGNGIVEIRKCTPQTSSILWGMIETTVCNMSYTYTCYYSNLNQSGVINYKNVSSYQQCYGNNVTLDGVYNKSSNTDLTKILSLNNNNWALYYASQNGNLITIYAGPKVNGNVYNPTPTVFYQINTSKHSLYNPVRIESYESGNTYLKIKN